MQLGLNYPIIVVFIIYILCILVVGFLSGKFIKNISDYILAGRNLSSLLTALGAGASDMSGWLLMALPGAAFINGINQIWLPIGLALGAYLNWQFVAKRLRVYTEVANNSLTIPAYLENRFHDHSKVLGVVTALVVLIFFTFYAAAGFVAGGLLTQYIFHIEYIPALLISASIIITYTCIGGFLAVSWIDFIQGSLMFFALLIVPCAAIYNLDGLNKTLILLGTQGQHYFDAFHGIGFLGIVSLLAWGLGYFGQPHIIVRFMAARSSNDIPAARFICMTWMILALYGAIFTGMVGAAYYKQMGTVLINPETIFLVLSEVLFNPWMAGVLIAAVLSAIMSTVSAQLLSAASALTEDLYRNLFRKNTSTRQLIIIARVSVLLIAAVAVMIAASSASGSTILELVAYAWSGIGASFGPVILISLYWRRMTRNAAIVGIITGAVTVIIWEIIGKQLGGMFHLYSIVPGFLLNCFAIYIVSCLDQAPNESVTKQFDLAIHKAK